MPRSVTMHWVRVEVGHWSGDFNYTGIFCGRQNLFHTAVVCMGLDGAYEMPLLFQSMRKRAPLWLLQQTSRAPNREASPMTASHWIQSSSGMQLKVKRNIILGKGSLTENSPQPFSCRKLMIRKTKDSISSQSA